MQKNVTFDDIARYTNFSKTTISRYFNKPQTLTARNRAIIRQALLDLDYKENKVAKILAKGKTDIVGVLLPNLYLHYFSEMLSQILATYEEFGYQFLVMAGQDDPEAEKKYIENLLSYQVEGLIVMNHPVSSRELADLSIPVVTIEREDEFISSVNCDNYMGAYQAAGLLAKHGCDILIHFNTPTPEKLPAWQRIKGFTDFCTEHSLRHEIIIRDTENNYNAFTGVLTDLLEELDQKYTNQKKGIFFSDDTRANVFLNALVRKYKTLPEDYRIVGFDNSPIAEQSVYSLSTVGQQISVIAHNAVELLHEQILFRRKNGPDVPLPVTHKVITPVLYRRETTEGVL